jgi:hypothetical protein
MGFINDEPDSGSEGCVTALDNGNEEGNIKVEENLEAIINTPIQPEVSVCCLCIRQKRFMLPKHLLPQKQKFCNTLQLSLCTYLAFYSSLSRPTVAQHIY